MGEIIDFAQKLQEKKAKSNGIIIREVMCDNCGEMTGNDRVTDRYIQVLDASLKLCHSCLPPVEKLKSNN